MFGGVKLPKKNVEGKSFCLYLDFEAVAHIDNLVNGHRYKTRSAAVCAIIHKDMRGELLE
jgi:hypothetical protein